MPTPSRPRRNARTRPSSTVATNSDIIDILNVFRQTVNDVIRSNNRVIQMQQDTINILLSHLGISITAPNA